MLLHQLWKSRERIEKPITCCVSCDQIPNNVAVVVAPTIKPLVLLYYNYTRFWFWAHTPALFKQVTTSGYCKNRMWLCLIQQYALRRTKNYYQAIGFILYGPICLPRSLLCNHSTSELSPFGIGFPKWSHVTPDLGSWLWTEVWGLGRLKVMMPQCLKSQLLFKLGGLGKL